MSRGKNETGKTACQKLEKTEEKTSKRRITIVLDYFGDEISSKIRKKKDELKLDIQICYKSKKLADLISKYNRQHTRKKDKIEEERKCDFTTRDLVYRMTCNECKAKIDYVGETGRSLKERFEEHTAENRKEENRTEPGRHALKVHGFNNDKLWKVEILHKWKDYYQRKIMESIEILKSKPLLNKRAGIDFIKIWKIEQILDNCDFVEDRQIVCNYNKNRKNTYFYYLIN